MTDIEYRRVVNQRIIERLYADRSLCPNIGDNRVMCIDYVIRYEYEHCTACNGCAMDEAMYSGEHRRRRNKCK